jgi:hypothetical protein
VYTFHRYLKEINLFYHFFVSLFSYHNGDHYNSVRRTGDLNSRTPPRIQLASLVPCVVPQQRATTAAAGSYRDNYNSGGGYCSSDSGAGISEDDSGKTNKPSILYSNFTRTGVYGGNGRSWSRSRYF